MSWILHVTLNNLQLHDLFTTYVDLPWFKAKFHYASWFEAGSKLVRSWFEAGSKLVRSFEPDSVMEFGFYGAFSYWFIPWTDSLSLLLNEWKRHMPF